VVLTMESSGSPTIFDLTLPHHSLFHHYPVAYTLTSTSEEPGVFYALGNKGCYRSADAGESWEPLPLPWKSDYEHQHPQALAISNV